MRGLLLRTVMGVAVAAAAWGAAPAACTPVDGDRILGRDLAAADPFFASVDPQETIAFAPAPGVRRVLGHAELVRLARRHHLAGEPALGKICFERLTQVLTPELLLPVLKKALDVPDARIEIVDYSRYPVPRGELRFSRAGLNVPLAAAPGAPALWRGGMLDSSRHTATVWARVRISLQRTWVEAREDLPAGLPVSVQQLVIRSGPQFPRADAPLSSPAQAAGLRPVRTIRAGQLLFARMLAAPPEVERGETVEVSVESGAAELAFEAQAEASGRAGDTIAVRNPANGRRFSAQVVAKGKVSVNAGNQELTK